MSRTHWSPRVVKPVLGSGGLPFLYDWGEVLEGHVLRTGNTPN